MRVTGFHLAEYLIEAFGLGAILFGASVAGTALGYEGSPVARVISNAFARSAIAGLVLGVTVLMLILSRWGRRSGAHFNPAFTLAFMRLGRIKARDAAWYMVFQIAGSLAGVLAAYALLGDAFALPPVSFLATVPGRHGVWIAFATEAGLAYILMTVVLWTASRRSLTRFTGPIVAALLAIFVLLGSPLSGTSLNPARSLASALPSGIWASLWIYLVAPPAGMMAAAELFLRKRGARPVGCARLSRHHPRVACILCGRTNPPTAATQSSRGN
jgi:aquaporin Z